MKEENKAPITAEPNVQYEMTDGRRVERPKEKDRMETIEYFEEVGEDNFGSKINKINWKRILKKFGITIFVIFILVMLLR